MLGVTLKAHALGTPPVVQRLGLRLPMQRVQVRPLVGVLRSHTPQGQNHKTYSRSNAVTNPRKDFTNGPHQETLKKKYTHCCHYHVTSQATVRTTFFFFPYRGLCSVGFPGGAVVKNPPANAGDERDVGSIPVLGRSPRVRNRNPFQYSCLENSMDRGAWWATVHGVAKSHTTEHIFNIL